MPNVPILQILTAVIIAGVLGTSGLLLSPIIMVEEIDVYLEPQSGTVLIGETFSIDIIVQSTVPVNAFQGLLEFNSDRLAVASIDYNTSIANLWAEEPWYSNGDGTIGFIGGSTKPGGFVGSGSLMTVTFTTKNVGDAAITLKEMRVLKHDGLGTEIPLPSPIDALFAVNSEELEKKIVLEKSVSGPMVTVVDQVLNTDLNNDGKQSIADTSIFMTDLLLQNLRSDFDQDGSVTLKDLSILNQ